MIFHCPCCHAQFSIETLTQDEAARELLGMRATMLPSLLPYLTLFRSQKRALAFDRELKLAKEVMEIDADPARLEAALANTVESLRRKRDEGTVKPLKDHRYLRSVLESTPANAGVHLPGRGTDGAAPTSKRAAALAALAAWEDGDWLRGEISAGLQALVAQGLKFQPGADMIAMNADIWYLALKKVCTIEQVDAPRIRAGFERLFPKVEQWPATKQLLELMPSRPPRVSLPKPEPTEEDRRTGKEALQRMREEIG